MWEYSFTLVFGFTFVYGSRQLDLQPIFTGIELETKLTDIMRRMLTRVTSGGVTDWDRPDVPCQTVWFYAEQPLDSPTEPPDCRAYSDPCGKIPRITNWHLVTHRRTYPGCTYVQSETGGTLRIPGLYEEKLRDRVASLSVTVESQEGTIESIQGDNKSMGDTIKILQEENKFMGDSIKLLQDDKESMAQTIATQGSGIKTLLEEVKDLKLMFARLSTESTKEGGTSSLGDDWEPVE
jgi:hypothetical protein